MVDGEEYDGFGRCLDDFVPALAGNVSVHARRNHFSFGELADDLRFLFGLLNLAQDVAVQSEDRLDLASVEGLLVEFLSKLEFENGGLEG